jgi:dTDP-4-amino-4,6-dideoxygalactose transaminase
MFGEDIQESDRKAFDPARPLDGAREYNSLMMGWMYRTTELTAALCRSQLRRLDHWLANARENAAYLSRALEKLPGITPPYIPPGCTSSFYQYRIRLDPRATGLDMPPQELRLKVLAALKAEGVEVSLWQTVPVPGQTPVPGATGTACPARGSAPGRGCEVRLDRVSGDAAVAAGFAGHRVTLLSAVSAAAPADAVVRGGDSTGVSRI